jgi:hypothetical protein
LRQPVQVHLFGQRIQVLVELVHLYDQALDFALVSGQLPFYQVCAQQAV